MDNNSIAASYAHPLGSEFAALKEIIVEEHLRASLSLFLQRNNTELIADASGVCDALKTLLDGTIEFELAWNLCCSDLLEYMQGRSSRSPKSVASSILLRAAVLGHPSDWSVTLNSSRSFLVGDVVSPRTGTLHVKADESEAIIKFDKTCGQLRFLKGYYTDHNSGALRLGSIKLRSSCCVNLSQEGQLDEALADLTEKVEKADESQYFLARVSSAMGLLYQSTPLYADWVAAVIRHACPLIPRPVEGAFDSGSRSACPGLLYMSDVERPLQLAETLVHEASHQHFYLLDRYIRLFDPSDDTLYYSAVKNTGRPIVFILLAYHAFSNICLMFQALQTSGYSFTAEEKEYERTLMAQITSLGNQLKGAGSLTEPGRAFYDSLASVLDNIYGGEVGIFV